tara:strand:- start:4109 stop:4339 length:231 start_codon:yes stop_codon:yes gene_type:complete
MALSKSVEDSLREAESSLRNALAYAARQEKPFIGKHIADMIHSIDSLISADALIDKIENRESGDSGFFGTTFDFDD